MLSIGSGALEPTGARFLQQHGECITAYVPCSEADINDSCTSTAPVSEELQEYR
jgi:hypothetical protein